MAAVAPSRIANPATNPMAIDVAQNIQDMRASKEYKGIWNRLKKVADYFEGIKGEYNAEYTAGVPRAEHYSDEDQAAFAGYVNIFNTNLIRDEVLDGRIQRCCSAVIQARVQQLQAAIIPTHVLSNGQDAYDARTWSEIGGNLRQALNDEAPPSCCVIL